ncbi:MAG: efflux RND transporter periplasmic adaptor subunit [Planctomycetota bacterium]
MKRFTTILFSTVAIVGAAVLLFTAIRLIAKNTPKQSSTEIRNLPPTAPGTVLTQSRTVEPGYIGGVGITEPLGEATIIGSQLPGVVDQLYVQPGMMVEVGTPLLRLDCRSAQADVGVAEADLAAQKAKLQELLAQVASIQARLDASQALQQQAVASELNAKREIERAQSVGSRDVLSEEELDARRVNYEIARAKRLEAEARVREAQATLDLMAGKPVAATVEVQRAAVAQAMANLERAKTNLEIRTIRAPKKGTVLSVKIREGEFVPASILPNPLITLGEIETLHLRIDIDESEIPRFHPNAPAQASVRGRPDVKVKIDYVRTEPLVIPKRSLTGTVIERVDTRVMQVIYAVDAKELGATVGQQVDVYIEDWLQKP